MAENIVSAKEAFFYTDEDGAPVLVHKGARYRAGHPVATKYADLFEDDHSVQEYEVKRPVGRPRKTDDE
jgi:hypothetical protein